MFPSRVRLSARICDCEIFSGKLVGGGWYSRAVGLKRGSDVGAWMICNFGESSPRSGLVSLSPELVSRTPEGVGRSSYCATVPAKRAELTSSSLSSCSGFIFFSCSWFNVHTNIRLALDKMFDVSENLASAPCRQPLQVSKNELAEFLPLRVQVFKNRPPAEFRPHRQQERQTRAFVFPQMPPQIRHRQQECNLPGSLVEVMT